MKLRNVSNIDAAAVAEGIIREAERAELLEALTLLIENQEKVQASCKRINKILMANKR